MSRVFTQFGGSEESFSSLKIVRTQTEPLPVRFSENHSPLDIHSLAEIRNLIQCGIANARKIDWTSLTRWFVVFGVCLSRGLRELFSHLG